jgi:hypothetical protein
MTYRITQREDEECKTLTLLLEGSISAEAGSVIADICRNASQRYGQNILIDLHGVSFLAPESSEILCRLKTQQGLSFIGCHLFNKKVLDETEAK